MTVVCICISVSFSLWLPYTNKCYVIMMLACFWCKLVQCTFSFSLFLVNESTVILQWMRSKERIQDFLQKGAELRGLGRTPSGVLGPISGTQKLKQNVKLVYNINVLL